MGVSTTHRINLSMWILIYSFSGTYYVWASCATSGFPLNNNNNSKLINEAGSLCSSDSVEEENEIEEQSGRPDQRQIPVTERESENSTCRE